jgi:hypothetical protein
MPVTGNVSLLQTTPAMLARPRNHPNPIDPHAAVGGLVEAFDEVLDLRLHLLIPHGLGGLVDCPSSWPAGSGRRRRLLCRLAVNLVGHRRRAPLRVVEVCGVGDPAAVAGLGGDHPEVRPALVCKTVSSAARNGGFGWKPNTRTRFLRKLSDCFGDAGITVRNS